MAHLTRHDPGSLRRPWRIFGDLAVLIMASTFCVAAWASPQPDVPTRRVIFADGRSLEVVAVRMENDRAYLTLTEGDLIAIPAARVQRVEEMAAPEPQPSPEKPPEAETAPPAAGKTAASSEDLETIIREAAQRHGLEMDLLAAVIAVESGYRADAVSPKGAQGLMQLMPATARELEVTDPMDPRQNIDAGARYLKQLLDDNDGQYWRALAAYNAGLGRVARYDGLPPYRETIRYIKKVLDLYLTPQAIPGASSK